jgi:DNA polymerase-3 subunit alpha
MGIEVLSPDVNKSQGLFTIEGNAIRFGLIGIKSIGQPTVELLNKARELRQKEFANFEDFYTWFSKSSTNEVIDMIPTDATINLIKSGAFGADKNNILLEFGQSTYTPLVYKEKKGIPARADFKKVGIDISEEDYQDKQKRTQIFIDFKYKEYLEKDDKRRMKHLNEFMDKYVSDELFYEFDTMGCYLTVSPFDPYVKHIKDFYSYEDGADKILIVGTILTKDVKKASRGGQYAKLSLVTPHGILQGKCYSTQYSEYKHLLEKGESVVLLAKRNKDEFVLSKLKTFDEWKAIIEKKQKLKESAR